jgi:ribosome-associated protein
VTKTPRSAKVASKTKTSSGKGGKAKSAAAKSRDSKSGDHKLGESKAGTDRMGATRSAAGKSGAGKPGGGRVGGGKAGAGKSLRVRSGVRTKSPTIAPEPTAKPRTGGDLDQARDLALAAIEAALDKKALMPVLIDVSAMASYTDFIGIVSGRSDRQVEAIADGVSQFMKSRGRRVLGTEGSGNGRWTLLDFGEIVLHVFYHPVREFYDLESLWIDAPRVKMAIPPEAILTQPDALYGAL